MKIARYLLPVALLALGACSDRDSDPPAAPQAGERTLAPAASDSVAHQILDVYNVGETTYVRALAIDADGGRLWVGTSLGVNEIDLSSHALLNTFTREHGLANEYVFAIGIDPDGYKWFGTNAGGMSRYKDGDWKTYFPMHGLADYWIYAFANAADGGLWVGTWAGANYLDRASDRFETYVKELVNEWVYGISVDAGGNVWFATEGGVSRFDGASWRSWTHADGIGGENTADLPFSRNTGLGTRSRHDLGTLSGGQPTYNPGYVFSILAARDDTIWAGTWGGGVARYRDGAWSNLMQADGLAGNIVYAIAEAPDGALWFGTNRGLSRYDGRHWRSWNVHNGLAGNDVYAIAIAPDGDVWAGTRGGVARLGLPSAQTSSAHQPTQQASQ